MKLLRILTGIHAGAQLKLAAGAYRLAADDDADIRLSDWSGAELVLTVDARGAVHAQRGTAHPNGHDVSAPHVTNHSAHTDQNVQTPVLSVGPATVEVSTSSDDQGDEPILLLDFVPMQFDDTVICIGPADSTWPSDVELLSTLLVKPDQDRRTAERARRRKIAGITLACTAVGMIIGLGALLMSAQDSRAARRHDINDLAQHVNRLLAEQKLTELHAQVSGSVIRVTGMVPTAAEDANARDLLQRAAAGVALRQYDVAEVDARSIAESLGTPGVQVAYAGNGVFDVTAKVDDPQQFRQSLERVRRDLNKNVKTLRTHITAIDKNLLPSTYSELIESDAIQYAQAPDGTKHIYMAEQPYGQAETPEDKPTDDATVSSDKNSASTAAQVPSP